IKGGQLTPVRVVLKPAVDRTGAWVTTVFAALAVGGGIAMGVLANGLEQDLTDARDQGRLASNDDRLLTGQPLAIGADVAFGLGAILGAFATYYFLRDPLPDSEARVLEVRDWTLGPSLGPHHAGMTVGGRL